MKKLTNTQKQFIAEISPEARALLKKQIQETRAFLRDSQANWPEGGGKLTPSGIEYVLRNKKTRKKLVLVVTTEDIFEFEEAPE